ncbi:MAG: glycosyltransferase [Gracilibacteraceae bacterium]|jgi:glycosyltransferase involved in cell wall biosynthesis|nr:glycosyltransferase [Gracilibacteraceae bacterium]
MSDAKVIYTVIINQYDCLFPPLADQPGWDLICFTDDPSLTSNIWDVRPLPDLPELGETRGDPVRRARLVKILAHRFLTDYEYSVYTDANRVILGDMETFVQGGADDFVCLEGGATDPCAAAAAFLAARPSDDPCALEDPPVIEEGEAERLRSQIERWQAAGLPRPCGCPSTALLGRRHNAPAVAAVMEAWAHEVLTGSAWDEFALPYACFRVQGEPADFSPPWTERLSPFPAPEHLLSPAEELAARMPHRARLDGNRAWQPRVYPLNPPPSGGPYEGYPLLLTIGVPVSNQIGTIRRCLEGIRPLLDGLPAELVVVDTGSTDGTVEVCREYGARVLDFPWVDDMSAARNTAIRAARGLWYMSIDDDEWFEDVEPILDFFRSGRHADYDYASYIQHNYMVQSMKEGEDFPTPRLAKMRSNLHFHGRIHDTYDSGIIKDVRTCHIRAVAHHLGFAHIDEWSRRRKTARNIQGLRQDMSQYPTDSRFGFQMFREMSIIRDYPQAMRLAYWVMAGERGAEGSDIWRHMSIGQLTLMLFDGNWHRELVQFAERWLVWETYNPLSQCALLRVMLFAQTRLGEYKHANLRGLHYLEIRRELLALPEWEAERGPLLGELFIDGVKPKMYREVLRRMIKNYRLLRDHDTADLLLANEEMLGLFCEELAYRETTLDYLYQNRRWPAWRLMLTYYRRAGRTDGVHFLLAALAEWVQAEDYPEALRLVKDSGIKPLGFMAFMDLRLGAGSDEAAVAYQPAREFAAGLEGEARYRCQYALLREVFRLGLDPAPAVALMDIPAIDYIFVRLERDVNGPRDLWERLLTWRADIGPADGAMERYLALRVSEVLFIKTRISAQLDTDILTDYLERRRQWESELYAPGLLVGGGDPRLPPALRATCQMLEVIRLWREADYAGALRALKTAALLAEAFKETAETLAGRVTADFEREQRAWEDERSRREAEFHLLLRDIKPRAEGLIALGRAGEALDILRQLETLAPEDAEIKALIRRGMDSGMKPE